MTDILDDSALFHKAASQRQLLAGWSKVWANGGCAGGDHVSREAFAGNLANRISTLSKALKDGSYTPGAIREIEIPKKKGGVRRLRIPAIRDRIVQTAVAQILTPHFEKEFEDSSFGYRPGRGVAQAVERVSYLKRRGHVFVVDADIDEFFDSVSHDRMMNCLAQYISDGPLYQLIALWLEHANPSGRGLAQGSPLSPLLANLFLDELDEAFARGGARIVRYADDFLILCATRRGAENALKKTRTLLANHGLKLNFEKTSILPIERGVRFLGRMFVGSFVIQDNQNETDALAIMRRLAESESVEEAEKAETELRETNARKAGLDPGFRVLHLQQRGRRLNARNQAFTVEEAFDLADGREWREFFAVHHTGIDRIDIFNHCDATLKALALARDSETPIAFVDGHGATQAWLGANLSQRAARHLAQARIVSDELARLNLARHFVDGRMRNQRALLRRLNRTRKNAATLKALSKINHLIRRLPVVASVEQLMGFEGRAAALYWPALGLMLEQNFSFRTRERKKATPVNIMFNLTSSLLARDIAVAIDRASLHPGFGVLHAVQNNRDAAVFDLMEEFRAPLGESVVVNAINRKMVTRDQFTRREDGGYHMHQNATKAVIRCYEHACERLVKSKKSGRRRPWRVIMIEQAYMLAAHVEGRGDYTPYVMDY